jgi:cyclopropane fatty-acyl-phospholipid synthase-like methyltransferase
MKSQYKIDNDLVRQGYNKVADNYFKGRDQFKSKQYLDKLNTHLSPGSTILDIGCGAGVPVDKYLIELGHTVIGIDISERQIELAKQNLPQGNFTVQDMTKLESGEYQMDAVVSFYAIFHTDRENHLDILKKIYGFIKPGGYMLITMGASDWEGKEADFFGGEMYWSHYGAKKNRELVEKIGFDVLLDEIDGSGGEKHQVLLAKKEN